jgi:hypothetical protein
MLNISSPLNSSQAQTYHAKEFTSAGQNYWKQGDVNLGSGRGSSPNTLVFLVGLTPPISPVSAKANTQ